MFSKLNMLLHVITLITIINGIDGVIQGSLAKPGNFPFSASLSHVVNGHECGGAIISERHVLTAGHCVHDVYEWDYVIKVGVTDLSDISAEQYMVKEFHPHPEYVPETYKTEQGQSDAQCERVMDVPMKNDIAIVETCEKFANDLRWFSTLNQPVPTSYEQPAKRRRLDNSLAKIGTAKSPPSQCSMCTFCGWGCLSDKTGDPAARELRFLTMAIHSPEDCAREKCRRQKELFCAQHPSRTPSCAEGDSGSPLVCDGVVVGVLSLVSHSKGRSSSFVDVSQYQTFITSIIDKPQPAAKRDS